MSTSPPLQSIHDQIAACLRDDVRSGRLKPGESLREESLAQRFGISRSPIRQVLRQLTYEGLLQSKRNCGVSVAEPATPEIRDLLLPSRAQIELFALRSVFAELETSDFQRWEATVDAIGEAAGRKDVAAVANLDQQFHQQLVERAELPAVLSVWVAITSATLEYALYVKENLPDLGANHATHAALLAGFQSGHLDGACRLLSDHILDVGTIHEIRHRWEAAGKPYETAGLFDDLMAE